MSEDQDQSSKTEEPTTRKLEQAREKGQVASSKEVNTWFMILGITLLVLVFIPLMGAAFLDRLLPFIERPHEFAAGEYGFTNLSHMTFFDVIGIMLLPLLVLVIAGVLGGIIQNGLMFSPESLMPKLERISPIAGFKRLFSLKSVVDLLKAIVKLAVVSTVVFILLWPKLADLNLLTQVSIPDILSMLKSLVIRLVLGVLSVLTVIAAIDWLYQRFEFLKSMRMTKQELKDEYKQTEGDPMVKSRLRQIRQERARQRMMSAVPDSTVVITNPTHFAVALKYELESASFAAPMVVAKGADEVALRIRETAKEHDVPIFESPPLARALYSSTEIDQQIPEHHFEIVARVIGYIFRLQGKIPGQAGPRPEIREEDLANPDQDQQDQ